MLKQKIVVIAGGAGRIGREFARAVVRNGGTAVIADLKSMLTDSARDSIACGFDPTRFSFIALDITSKPSICGMIEHTHNTIGRIDAIVNSAYPRNANYGRAFEKVELQDFCENVSLHMGGYFLVAQQAIEYFRRQGGGNIVNIASVYGVIAPRFEVYEGTEMTMPVEYAVIKSGIIHLGRYLAKYLKGDRIRVNTISPGACWPDSPPVSWRDIRTSP